MRVVTLGLALAACTSEPVAGGDAADMVLTDATGAEVALSDFAGDVVGMELAALF